MIDAQQVKESTDLIQLVSQETSLKRVANTGGGEYAGPCPFCGGTDRFRVQVEAPPGKKPEGSRWMCRHCSPKWGDVIGYVMRRDNLDFVEALEKLVPGKSFNQQNSVNVPFSSNQADNLCAQWVDNAFEFLEDCVNYLWGDEGKGARTYLHQRGLAESNLKRWLIGYNPIEGYGDPGEWGLPEEEKVWLPQGIVIPCQDEAGMHYLKIRRRVGNPKYYLVKGSRSWLFGAHTFTHTSTGFLFEGEFDVMLAYQTGFTGVGYASIPAGKHLQPEWSRFLNNLYDLIIAFDNDEAGQKAAKEICNLSPKFHKSNLYPQGNDLTEYYQATGSLDNVFLWLYDQVGILNGKN